MACVIREGETATLPESESSAPYYTPAGMPMEWHRCGIT